MVGAGGYASVNGLEMYYEVHGAGEPLVLLHGSFGGAGSFGDLLPRLAGARRVIVVEMQGHGRTADIDRPLSFESMADDTAALLKHLRHEKADVLGYSMGGGVALQTAVRHPGLARRLVVVSARCKSDGWHTGVLARMRSVSAEAARTWIGSPMHQAYASAAPRPEDWPRLADKMGRLHRQKYDWSREVAAIKSPTMVAIGDADGVRPAHAVEFFGLLGGGKGDVGWDGPLEPNARLAILPGTTHVGILSSPLLAAAAAAFLEAPVVVAEERRPAHERLGDA